MDYQLNDIVEMKKQHPCKKSNQWKIVRMGADIKIKCLGCNAIVMSVSYTHLTLPTT